MKGFINLISLILFMGKRDGKKKKSRISNVSPRCGRTKGIVSDYLPWILIAVAVLVIVLLSIFLLKGKGISLIDKLKGLFR